MDGEATTRDDAPRAVDIATRRDGAVLPDPAIVDPAEHNIVFTNLVTGDRDIVGLVAYSIYKQNKYDWLQAYSRFQGRMPNAEEAQAYLLGESTPRRLATYRHLAEAVLDGRGPDVPGAAAGEPGRRDGPRGPGSPARTGAARATGSTFPIGVGVLVALAAALVALLILLWMLRGGAPMPPVTPAR